MPVTTRGLSHTSEQEAVAKLSLGANVFLVTIKIAAGLASGSLSVLAEGIQSFLDIFASAAILWTLRAASAPPDTDHPYGHGKFENVVSLGQMVLIFASIIGIWAASWQRFNHPIMPRVDWGIAAIMLSGAINLAVSARVAHIAKKHNSTALAAEAVHLRGDLWSCVGILLGLVATHIFQEPRLDPVFAAGMTLFAVANAIHLLRDIIRPLVDESLPDGEETCIREVLLRDPRVLGFHKLRTRQAGSQKLADVHILLDDDLSFRDAHRIGEEVEEALRAALPNLDIMVHAEPFYEEIAHQRERHQRDSEWERGELGGWEKRSS